MTDHLHESSFTVYVRADKRHRKYPDALERPLVTCSSYAEAREIQRQYRQAHQETVIRYDGVAGGGD